ncbi:MAG TPA: Dabb family protein [Candidatus Synoicihabitans sp.]|nr:Dabb family protein [Candidatus Synoicihabitans sp.]
MKKLIMTFLFAGLMALGSAATAAAQSAAGSGAAAASQTAPKTLLHVVTVSWKEGTTDEQIKAALDGAQALPKSFPGITRVWTKTVKAQGDRTHVIAMEFTGEQALKEYADSAAQKEWYKVYTPIRGRSTTFDVTN